MIEFELPTEPIYSTDTANSIMAVEVFHATYATNVLQIPIVCRECHKTYYVGSHPDNGCRTGVIENVHST